MNRKRVLSKIKIKKKSKQNSSNCIYLNYLVKTQDWLNFQNQLHTVYKRGIKIKNKESERGKRIILFKRNLMWLYYYEAKFTLGQTN